MVTKEEILEALILFDPFGFWEEFEKEGIILTEEEEDEIYEQLRELYRPMANDLIISYNDTREHIQQKLFFIFARYNHKLPYSRFYEVSLDIYLTLCKERKDVKHLLNRAFKR